MEGTVAAGACLYRRTSVVAVGVRISSSSRWEAQIPQEATQKNQDRSFSSPNHAENPKYRFGDVRVYFHLIAGKLHQKVVQTN